MKIVLTENQISRLIENTIDEMDYESFHTSEELQDLRDAIDKNKMVGVAFVTKDGTVRHMSIRRRLSSYTPSEAPKSEKQLNVERNNDIKRVIDINSYKKNIKRMKDQNPDMNIDSIKEMAVKYAWRTINLKNVLGFMVAGRFIDLRDENDIMDRFGEEVYNSLTKSMINALNAGEE